MKKQLLLFITLFVSVGLFAQTISMTDNSANGAANSFQAKVTNLIPSDYEAKTGDLITVNIAGTADYDLTNFQVAFVDTRESAGWWDELSGFKALGDVTAGTAFDFSVTVAITKDAAGAGPTYCNLVLDGVSTEAGDASAAAVELSLTTFDISIESNEEGVISLTDNGDGAFQGEFPDTLATDPAATVGDVVRVTVEGTSNVDITNFQAIVVDGTEAASYWTELSEYTLLGDGNVTAGTPFTLTADIDITAAPVGTGFKSQYIVLMGEATETIKLTLTNFTAEIVDAAAVSIEPVFNSEIISISEFSVNGVYLGSVESISELGPGLHILEITYANGYVEMKKYIKNK
ncbi:MAG: hypothetical protein R6U95_02140 [Bacteroidales bacterium]